MSWFCYKGLQDVAASTFTQLLKYRKLYLALPVADQAAMKIQGAATGGSKLAGVLAVSLVSAWYALTIRRANLAGDTTTHKDFCRSRIIKVCPQIGSVDFSLFWGRPTQLPCSAMARGVALREQMRGQHRAAAYVGQPSNGQ